MSSPDLGPLAMSQTKDDLVKHLNISAETYTLMAVAYFGEMPPQAQLQRETSIRLERYCRDIKG
ncbi:hypothetical protein BGAL_0023g00110 [Botrytis galanthina]|uniref:Uncharacterized protein n=1 Tax=Botrytis galanthina TaxID=278940 RepID=A0A4S8RBQ7_9HELO|nr:hypothetical protein BGAL_0023g00110 [Botrytis galanthina]